jgi:hypothetical protein
MIGKEHVGIGIIAETITSRENEESVKQKGKQNSEKNAARNYESSISSLERLIRFLLLRFSSA